MDKSPWILLRNWQNKTLGYICTQDKIALVPFEKWTKYSWLLLKYGKNPPDYLWKIDKNPLGYFLKENTPLWLDQWISKFWSMINKLNNMNYFIWLFDTNSNLIFVYFQKSFFIMYMIIISLIFADENFTSLRVRLKVKFTIANI